MAIYFSVETINSRLFKQSFVQPAQACIPFSIGSNYKGSEVYKNLSPIQPLGNGLNNPNEEILK
jgi:hypothetical protein